MLMGVGECENLEQGHGEMDAGIDVVGLMVGFHIQKFRIEVHGLFIVQLDAGASIFQKEVGYDVAASAQCGHLFNV